MGKMIGGAFEDGRADLSLVAQQSCAQVCNSPGDYAGIPTMVNASDLAGASGLSDASSATIEALSARIRCRQLSPVDVLQGCLDRIDALNPHLNAFITVLADQALAEAKTAQEEIRAGHWRGPLHGIPIGIKDMFDTAGIKTTAAHEKFKTRVPAIDAAAVSRLKSAGAVVIGKTNMHRLAMGTTSVDSAFGAVRNPWNLEHIAGGSSGGSAAAIAARMCYATLDTDAIGSCRLPASCCGVSGFKGTYGLVSNSGVLAGEPVDDAILWLAHAAITARSARDAAIVLSLLAEPGSQSVQKPDYFAGLNRRFTPRIGIVTNFESDREVAAAFETAVQALRRLGNTREIVAPLDNPGFDVRHIAADRRRIAGSLFEDLDVIALPTTVTPPPTIQAAGENATALSAHNTLFANYCGLPAISVPCGFNKSQLPLGVQIVGKPQDDQVVLCVADQFQGVTAWHKRYPTLAGLSRP
jgi:aspartyl-tRNA(Asn)/glutamyl-tRNA(Gln) amidotransferase subunit A